MNAVTIIAKDDAADTVTISRSDFESLLAAGEDAEDLRAVQAVRTQIAQAGGIEAYRAASLDADGLRRVLDGESVVKIMREKRGLTQARLGDQAGVSTATIGMIETGQRKPSVSALIRIARVLGVSTDDLLI